jgi:CO dehydrogenase maturation factor
MKICVCGKGGSGKSTVVSLLADGFRKLGKQVVVLDSDESNSSLFWMLGLDAPPRALMDLVGGKKAVQGKMLAKFTSGEEEPRMSIWENDKLMVNEIPQAYSVNGEGIRLVATGKIHQSMEGCACPMGAVTREFLKRLQLEPDEITIVDMEAGIEHFGRGIEASVDMVIGVVEPSLESISLTKKVMDLTESSGAVFKGAILNKILSSDQESQVSAKVNNFNIPIIGTIGFHTEFQATCLEGKALNPSVAFDEIDKIIGSILDEVPKR